MATTLVAQTGLSAHVFVQPYTLPVPLWMYVYACIATLIASFALVAYFAGNADPPSLAITRQVAFTGMTGRAVCGSLRIVGRVVSVAALMVTVVAAFIGTTDPAANISLVLFWVVFLLGLTYLTAILGDIYSLVNPWLTLTDLLEQFGLDLSRPRLPYPLSLGYWPALAGYVAIVWIELFVLPQPRVVGWLLVGYTALVLAGSWAFGKQAWFQRAETFAVFFRVVGTMAPLAYERSGPDGGLIVRVRWPFVGALQASCAEISLVLFILFMLSSTTYDALHETYFWVSVYWQHLLPIVRAAAGGGDPFATETLISGYVGYQRVGLVLSPFVYLLAYMLALASARSITGIRQSLGAMSGQFAFTLVPIALVYHATHYYTILVSSVRSLKPLATDPFGWGWHLLGVIPERPEIPLSMGTVWHTQVALMLIGHIVAVYLAHLVALRLFAEGRQSIASQLPMLILMVGYTYLGLWVLSLPLAVPQVLPLG